MSDEFDKDNIGDAENTQQEENPFTEDKANGELGNEIEEIEPPEEQETPVGEKEEAVKGGNLIDGGKNKKPFFAAVAVVVVVVLALLALKAGIFPQKNIGAKDNVPVLYGKEDTLYLYNLKNDPIKIADGLENGGSYHYFYFGWGTLFSDDMRYLFFENNNQADGSFDLYRKQTTGDETPVLIDTGVLDYNISKDGNAVAYLKASQDGTIQLYTSDFVNKYLIKDYVEAGDSQFQISGDGQKIVYLRKNDLVLDLYYADLSGENELLVNQDITGFAAE